MFVNKLIFFFNSSTELWNSVDHQLITDQREQFEEWSTLCLEGDLHILLGAINTALMRSYTRLSMLPREHMHTHWDAKTRASTCVQTHAMAPFKVFENYWVWILLLEVGFFVCLFKGKETWWQPWDSFDRFKFHHDMRLTYLNFIMTWHDMRLTDLNFIIASRKRKKITNTLLFWQLDKKTSFFYTISKDKTRKKK